MVPSSSQEDWTVAGIDLGTSNCCVSVYHNGKSEVISLDGSKTIPSIVTFYENKIEYGQAAKQHRSMRDAMPVYELKRLFGIPYEQYRNQCTCDTTTYQVVKHDNKCWLRLKDSEDNSWDIAPEQVYSMLFAYLFKCASDLYRNIIKGVVITVPANFTPIQIHEMIISAKMAGLRVLRVIYEPNAAALYYSKIDKTVTGDVLVCDVGGGTTDITLMKYSNNAFSIEYTTGNPHLGGCDFDRVLAYLFCDRAQQQNESYHVPAASNQFLRVVQKIENYKLKYSAMDSKDKLVEFSIKDLLDVDTEDVINISVKDINNEFMHLYDQIVMEAKKCVKSKGWADYTIQTVLLVGGSSRLPLIRKKFEDAFSNANVIDLPDPDTIVSQGACEIAWMEYCSMKNLPVPSLPVKFVDMLAFDLKYYLNGKEHIIFHNGEIITEEQITCSLLKVPDNKLVIYMGDQSHDPNNDVKLGYFEIPMLETTLVEFPVNGNDFNMQRRTSGKNEMKILIDKCVGLRMTIIFGGNTANARFVYNDDLDEKDVKYITALNSIYNMMARIKRLYSRRNDVMRLVQTWEAQEVLFRFHMHRIKAEENCKNIKDRFQLSYYCLL